MSYTSTDQLLAPAIEKIIEGINEFDDAARQRVLNPETWKHDHLVELVDLQIALAHLRLRLSTLVERER
jgi:hypothetical protein